MNHNKPDIIQAFDVFEDRVYKKIIPRFFGSSTCEVRTDRVAHWIQWEMHCERLPDKVIINGEEYQLIKQ